MFKKIALAAVVCIGTMAVSQTSASAGDCYDGRRYSNSFSYNYRPSLGIHHSYMLHRVPPYHAHVPVRRHVHGHVHPHARAPYSVHRYGYGVPRYGYGYSSYRGYSRGGISIGIGF